MIGTVLGPVVHAFLIDHLVAQRGLRRSTVASYRDTLRLFLVFVAADNSGHAQVRGAVVRVAGLVIYRLRPCRRLSSYPSYALDARRSRRLDRRPVDEEQSDRRCPLARSGDSTMPTRTSSAARRHHPDAALHTEDLMDRLQRSWLGIARSTLPRRVRGRSTAPKTPACSMPRVQGTDIPASVT